MYIYKMENKMFSNNTTTTTMNSLTKFLKQHKTNEKDKATHFDMKGGKFNITGDDLNTFYTLCKENFNDLKNYSIVEKQNEEESIILIDLDFRLKEEPVENHIFLDEHIMYFIDLVFDKLALITDNVINNEIYIFKRDKWYKNEKNIIKDGLHFIIPKKLNRKGQQYLRELVIEEMESVFGDLEFKNSYNDIYDEAITKGNVGWMLYGCSKPNTEPYKLYDIFKIDGIEDDCFKYISIKDTKNIDLFYNDIHPKNGNSNKYEIKDEIKKELQKYETKKNKKQNIVLSRSSSYSNTSNPHHITNDEISKSINLNNIQDSESLFNEYNKIKNNETEKVMEYLNALPYNYSYDYNKWIRVGWSLKNENENYFILWLIFSSKCNEKFDFMDVDIYYDKYWNSWNKMDTEGLTLKTIYYWLKNENPDKYYEIYSKYYNFSDIHNFRDNNLEVAELFIDLKGQDHIYYDGCFYYFNGLYWQKNEGHKLRLDITYTLKDFYTNELKKIQRLRYENPTISSYEEKEKCLTKTLYSITNSNPRKGVIDMVRDKITKDNDFKMNVNPYVIAFKNKIFDFKKNDFTEPNREDYITMTTGYNWREPTNEEMNNLYELLEKIFPLKDERELYLSILSTGLLGITLEKFIIANGGGGNGKGVLNELMVETIGDYGYTLANDVLLGRLKQGNNPQVANLDNKRFVLFREPDEKQSLCISTIKEITGGSEINARNNYSNKTTTKINLTLIGEFNKKLKVDGRIDDAVSRRIIDIPFRSTFTTNPDDFNGDYVFKANPYFKSQEFKETYKYALFRLLCYYCQKVNNGFIDNSKLMNIDEFIPDTIKERTKDYLMDSDPIKTWFDEEYERTGNKEDVIQIKDMYSKLKESDLYLNMNKKEKRNLTKKEFVIQISTNLFLRKDFKERLVNKDICKIYGKKEMRNVLIGYKKIQKDYECDIEYNNDDY